MRDDLGVGLAGELRALFLEPIAQIAEILDDAVVHDCDVVSRMWMGVVLRGLAVGGPTGVADTDMPRQWRGLQHGFQVFQFALGAAAVELHAFQRCYARRVITAIFKPFRGIDQLVRNRTPPQNTYNAAHAV